MRQVSPASVHELVGPGFGDRVVQLKSRIASLSFVWFAIFIYR